MKNQIETIIMFCYGDSTKASTWSNVPYLMSQAFIEAGVEVARCNIAPHRLLDKGWHKMVMPVLKAFGIKNYSFIRTLFFKWMTERKIRAQIKKHPDADYCVFLTFEFYNRFSDIPSLLFMDWTYKILVEERVGYRPSWLDRRFMNQQCNAISHADIVLPLFSDSYEKMRIDYPLANLKLAPTNVINNLYQGDIDSESDTVIDEKIDSHAILFIGGRAYLEGLKIVVEALANIHDDQICLDVIGMNEADFPNAPLGVKFHGYLHKEYTVENSLYYRLLRRAKIVVNPTPTWGGYSSIVEAMYFYTPVIVTPYKQFTDEFGSELDFGKLVEPTSNSTQKALEEIFNLPKKEYQVLCRNAHMRVRNYTWRSYVDYMIRLMNETKHKNIQGK